MTRWLLLALAAAAPAAHSQEDPSPLLSRGKAYYQSLDYEKCVDQLIRAKDAGPTRPQRAEIELYLGLCQYNLGLRKAAEDRFEAAVEANPDLDLPLYTSPKLVDLFRSVQTRVRRQRPDPAAAPEEPDDKDALARPPDDTPAQRPPPPDLTPIPKAPPPTLVEPARPQPRSRPLMLPIAFGTGAVLSAGIGTYLGLQAKALERQANAAPFESDAIRVGEQAQDHAIWANVAFGIAVGAVAGAVLSYALAPE